MVISPAPNTALYQRNVSFMPQCAQRHAQAQWPMHDDTTRSHLNAGLSASVLYKDWGAASHMK